jgi:hypothetical protein
METVAVMETATELHILVLVMKAGLVLDVTFLTAQGHRTASIVEFAMHQVILRDVKDVKGVGWGLHVMILASLVSKYQWIVENVYVNLAMLE